MEHSVYPISSVWLSSCSVWELQIGHCCGQGGRCDPRATQRPIACPPWSRLHSFCKTGSHFSDLVSFLRWLGCVYSWEFLTLISLLAFSRGDAAASILPGVVGRKGSQHPWGKHTLNFPVFGGGPCPRWRAPCPEAIAFPLSRGSTSRLCRGWEGAFLLLRGGVTSTRTQLCLVELYATPH